MSRVCAQHLAHIDFLEEQLDSVAQFVGQHLTAMPSVPPQLPPSTLPPSNTEGVPPLTWQAAITILDRAPGVDTTDAQQVLAEIGINMQQFPSADHLSAWGGLAPAGAHWARQSGGKRFHERLSAGNRQLRTIMVQIAWVASRTKGTYLAAFYRRLAAARNGRLLGYTWVDCDCLLQPSTQGERHVQL